jgi:paraquat-inducible protein B
VINNKTFVDKTFFRTIVDDARGLRGKPAIFFKGLEIGRIEAFRLNADTNDIEVDFYVFDKYKNKVVRHAILGGYQNTLLGDITPFELILPQLEKVSKYQALPAGEMVPHIDSELAQAYLKNGLIEVQGDSVESIIASVNTLLLNLQKENNPQAGSIFRILDRLAKITDHLLTVSQSLRKSSLLPEAEKMVLKGKGLVEKIPETMSKIDNTILSVKQAIDSANTLLIKYQQPELIVSGITDGKVPLILDNFNTSLTVLQTMLNDVHAQREQLSVTVHSVQQVLDKLDKTLQGLNNNPLLKPGIEQAPKNKGIEMND